MPEEQVKDKLYMHKETQNNHAPLPWKLQNRSVFNIHQCKKRPRTYIMVAMQQIHAQCSPVQTTTRIPGVWPGKVSKLIR